MKIRSNLITFGLAAVMLAQPAFAADNICKELKLFSQSKFDASEKPNGRRWVEFHWGGEWAGPDALWPVACKPSPDVVSKKFCSYLINNSSREFSSASPMRILSCYGYGFSGYTSWSNWQSDIDIWDKENFMLLEVRFGEEDTLHAIRLSAFHEDLDETLVELPPIQPFQSADVLEE